MEQKFYKLSEAAAFLKLPKHCVVDLAAEKLPVCFQWRGNLGLYAKSESQQEPVYKFDGYLRSLERVRLNRVSEYYGKNKSVRTFTDTNLARMVNVADSLNRLSTPPVLGKGECFVRLDDAGKPVSTSIPKSDWRFHIDDLRALAELTPSGAPENDEPPLPSNDWRERARAIADECFSNDTANNCRDSLGGYSSRVMDEMQKRGIHGPRGLIDNHKTIQREALQSLQWWAGKPK